MKNLKLLSVVLFVAVALIVPSCLYASTLTYETGPVTIPSTTTDWTQNLNSSSSTRSTERWTRSF